MHIICATKTEALPIIDALHLHQIAHKPFTIYQNPHHTLIISGIGTIQAAAATSYILALTEDAILNIGYAAGKEVGKLFHIHKVIDSCSNKVFHLPKSTTLPNMACTTYPLPQTKPTKTLADMEAASIVQAAKIFKAPITILKVVSDRFDPNSFIKNSSLIEKNLDVILSQIGLQSAQNF